MIKVRLHGTAEELAIYTQRMDLLFNVLSCSAAYKDRGSSQYARVYMDIDILKAEAEEVTNKRISAIDVIE